MWSLFYITSVYFDPNPHNINYDVIKLTFTRHFGIVSIKNPETEKQFFFKKTKKTATAWENKLFSSKRNLSKTYKWKFGILSLFKVLLYIFPSQKKKIRKKCRFLTNSDQITKK